ncbi:MAG TPA: hypothetical protein VHM48_15130, partial [Candidatus Limnocylindrales bacterium]|nr:hypothetical protein [Candidatus Limnocylindrales bacterium]
MIVAAIALVAGSTLLPYPAAAQTVAPTLTAPSVSPSAPSPDKAAADTRQRANAGADTDQVVLAFSKVLGASEARSAARLKSLALAAGSPVKFVRLLDSRHAVYRLASRLGDHSGSTLAAMARIPDVARAEPDPVVSVADLPDDAYAPQLWG